MDPNLQPPTGTEALVCEDIARRQAFGRQKYGTTVAENPLSEEQWIQHAYEEALDLAVYLRRLLSEKRDKTPTSLTVVEAPTVFDVMARLIDDATAELPLDAGIIMLVAVPDGTSGNLHALKVDCMTNLAAESVGTVLEQFLSSHPHFTTNLPG